MKKSFITLLLLAITFVSITACGGEKEPQKTPEEIAAEEAEAANQEAANEAADIAVEFIKSQLKNPHSMKVLESITVYNAEYVEVNFSAENNVGGTVESTFYGLINTDTGEMGTYYVEDSTTESDVVSSMAKLSIMQRKTELMTDENNEWIFETVSASRYND